MRLKRSASEHNAGQAGDHGGRRLAVTPVYGPRLSSCIATKDSSHWKTQIRQKLIISTTQAHNISTCIGIGKNDWVTRTPCRRLP